MRRARWLASWKGTLIKPVIYHCISRVVDRRYVLGDEEREHFRMFMRIQENFTGCRVLSYCIMSNHFHVMLEVPPMPMLADGSGEGLSDEELLKRLSAIYGEDTVIALANELCEARKASNEALVANIHARFTYRMHSLSEFMKTLLQRFTRWFNRAHRRRGTLWEERFKSVLIENGATARTIAAYIDLNPVRAAMVGDPVDYRWSSYGEAMGGGRKGTGKKAREGLVRAFLGHERVGFEADRWDEVARLYRRLMGLAIGRKPGHSELKQGGRSHTILNTEELLAAKDNGTLLPDIGMASMLMCRIRYFSDGAVIGSKSFVNEAFVDARERFSAGRKDGARSMRGAALPARQHLWSMRNLRVDV